MIHASAITICDASTFASPIAWWIHSSISSLIQNNRKSMTNCESRQLYTLSNSQNSSQNTQKHCGLGAPHYRPLCSTSPVSLLPFAAVAVLSATTVISLHSLAVPQRSHGLDEDLTLCERRVTLLGGAFLDRWDMYMWDMYVCNNVFQCGKCHWKMDKTTPLIPCLWKATLGKTWADVTAVCLSRWRSVMGLCSTQNALTTW